MKSYTDITFKYLKLQKKRSILTLLGIVLSVALIAAIGTTLVSIRDKKLKDAISDTGNYYAEFQNVKKDEVKKISQNVNVSFSSITADQDYAYIAKRNDPTGRFDNTDIYLKINGYNQNSMKLFPIKLKDGRLPKSDGEIAVDYWVNDYMPTKLKIGSKVKLSLGKRVDATGKSLGVDDRSDTEKFNKVQEKEYTVVGFINPEVYKSYSSIMNGITFIDDNKLNNSQKYDVYVRLYSVNNIRDKIKKIASDAELSNGYTIKYNDPILRLSAQSINLDMNKGLIGTLIFIVLLIIVSTIAVIYNAFNISVMERISQFGLLRCIGSSPSQIRKIVMNEAFILSVIGIPLGLVCGLLAMKIVFFIIGLLKFEYLDGVSFSMSPIVLVISSIIGLITVYISAYGPAKKASKISPTDAVRNAGDYSNVKVSKTGKGRIAGLFFGITGQMASKNLRRNKKRFRITVFSMVISIVLYIVFGSFIGYAFKMGVVSGKANKEDFTLNMSGRTGLNDKICNDIKNLQGVDKAYKLMASGVSISAPEEKINEKHKDYEISNTESNGISEDCTRSEIVKNGDSYDMNNNLLVSYGDSSIKDLKSVLKDGNADIDLLNKENGVIIMQTITEDNKNKNKSSVFDLTNYKVGDTITLSTNYDKKYGFKYDKKVKVVGIISRNLIGDQYNSSTGITLYTTEKVYKNLIGNNNSYQMFIILNKNHDKTAVANYLKKLNNEDSRYQYEDYSEQAKQTKNDFITISIFLYGFVGVITLIGCLNIINTISTNIVLRTKELSMLKAVGMTQNGIKKMICLEGMIFGFIASIYGAIIGTGLSYVLFKIMLNIRDFQWNVPWNQIITAAAGAIIFTLISGYIPLKRINDRVIIENIRMVE